MIGIDTNKIIWKLLHKYQIGLEQPTRCSIFSGYLSGMHYICNKIDLSLVGSYINSHKWINDKKATINPKKKKKKKKKKKRKKEKKKKKKKKKKKMTATIFSI